MIPPAFDYVRPADLGEVFRILREREGEAKILSGGYSLIPVLKLRLAQPALLVDIQSVTGLDGIVETDDELRIGARCTHRQILEHPIIARYQMLHDVPGGVGDPQVRNWGTIGGSIAHADPASDWPAAHLAANARVICRSDTSERHVPARDFFLDTFTTALEPTEVVTEIHFRRRPKGMGGAYTKLERRAGDFSTVGVAALTQLDDAGRISWAGIGVTGVSPSPFAATDAEAMLVGGMPSDELFRQAGAAAAAQSEPVADIRGPVDFKRAMVAEHTVRSLRIAAQRAMANT